MRSSTMVGLFAALALGVPGMMAAQGAPDGKALFEKSCKSCHGPRGVPPKAMASMKIPTFTAAFIKDRSKDSLVHVMQRGGKNMKGFDGKLSAAEMTAIATYLRELVAAEPEQKPAQKPNKK